MDTKYAGIVETEQAEKGRTLLVVDDDEALRKMEVLMLIELGYTVLEAEGPAEAMQLVASAPTIHLLLTDFSMPKANGLELARHFRTVRPGTPVLMVSDSLDAIYGRDDYPDRFAVLAKPFTRAELVDRVGALLSHSAAHPADP